MFTRARWSRSNPSSSCAIFTISPSYVNDFEHSSPNVHAIFLRHLFTRRACIDPGIEDWHPIPTSATLDKPSSAALRSASGLALYVYRLPGGAGTPARSGAGGGAV